MKSPYFIHEIEPGRFVVLSRVSYSIVIDSNGKPLIFDTQNEAEEVMLKFHAWLLRVLYDED